jgi:hypothetical protein
MLLGPLDRAGIVEVVEARPATPAFGVTTT